jgi:hypothetical protein
MLACPELAEWVRRSAFAFIPAYRLPSQRFSTSAFQRLSFPLFSFFFQPITTH